MRTTVTPSTPSTMTRTITTRTIFASEHSSAPLVVFHVSLMMCHTTLAQVVQVSVIFTPCCTCVSLSDLFDLPFYFDLSFTVFFTSSVLMHPDLHADLDNLDSVENNLSHSAKGSLDAYDVTFSLTNSAKLVKISPGIIARLHHTDRRLMVLLREQCAE